MRRTESVTNGPLVRLMCDPLQINGVVSPCDAEHVCFGPSVYPSRPSSFPYSFSSFSLLPSLFSSLFSFCPFSIFLLKGKVCLKKIPASSWLSERRSKRNLPVHCLTELAGETRETLQAGEVLCAADTAWNLGKEGQSLYIH